MADQPQFGTAEYNSGSDPNQCKTCGRSVGGSYFRVNGAMTCSDCAKQTAGMQPTDSHSVFVRGMVFGLIGAMIGLVLYSAVGIITGLEIGYVSIAVGYIVGRAVLFGTAGIGGRRYQILAAVLTYCAVSMSAVPISLSQVFQQQQQTTKAAQPVSAKSDAAGETEFDSEPTAFGLLTSVVVLTAIGLFSPVLGMADPLSGLIGLVILFVGLRIAWSLTEGNPVKIMGPYTA